MEEFLALVQGILPKIDFAKEENLVDDSLLDSLDIVSLISEISSEYDVEIPAEEIVPENFNSAKAMYALVQKLEEE